MEIEKRRAHGTLHGHANVIESAAVSASLLCLAHCVALPLFILLLPGAIGLFASSEAFHYVALGLVLPSALAAFGVGFLQHRLWLPVLFGVAGVGCLIVALSPGLARGAETWITVAGSLFLVTGHVMNWRMRAHAAGRQFSHGDSSHGRDG